MVDFFEIDLLKINAEKSGDAIAIRYSINNIPKVNVVDGGFQDTGDDIIKHIKTYYGTTSIDNVVVSHPHEDHTSGLRKVLEDCWVGELWMLCPWNYTADLIDRFYYRSEENLAKELKKVYPYIAELEEIAQSKGIPIYEPFQGAKIGAFTVLAPTKDRYLDLIVESDNTPKAAKESISASFAQSSMTPSNWGEENFPDEGTDCENEMSVVQYANLCGERILLTADAGRAALEEAADYAVYAGLYLPGIDRFQIPHHGSRHNLSSEILDRLLGEKLPSKPTEGNKIYSAFVSAAKKDEDHPTNTVVRACIHRGGMVFSNQDDTLCCHSANAPARPGWSSAKGLSYPKNED